MSEPASELEVAVQQTQIVPAAPGTELLGYSGLRRDRLGRSSRALAVVA
ncbi:MAG: hypothetical protein HC900_12430, partial [Methylacidiphilales bacterium]|nr:hypothetical protein [Candidatus Methylacidiphilales bacterium]